MTLSIGAPTVWNPLNQQYAEPDTLFLLDPDVDSALGYGINSGNVFQGALLNGVDANAPSIVAGRFRKGIQPSSTSAGNYVWCPGFNAMLATGEGTIEFWLSNSTVGGWGAVSNENFYLGEESLGNFVEFTINAGVLTVTFQHTQSATIPYTFSQATPTLSYNTASTWVCVAITLKGGLLTIYTGKQGDAQITSQATKSGFISPVTWGETARTTGLTSGADLGTSKGHTDWTFSDLRLSRFARTPGQVINSTDQSDITINTGTSGTVQPMNGLVHPIATGANASNVNSASIVPNETAAATAKAQTAIGMMRMPGKLSCAPIASSATQPNAGHSGAWWYDWQATDRDSRYISELVGCAPYVTITGTPSVIGGASGPFANTAFTAATVGGQQPWVGGTMQLTAPTAGQTSQKEFTAPLAGGGTVRCSYTGVSGNNLTGCALLSPATTTDHIADGATVNVGYLTGRYSFNSSTNSQIPNNMTSFGQMCSDLAYHLRSENNVITGSALTNKPVYFALWNEPDQGSGPGTTVVDYLNTYDAMATALKTLDATIKVGGPEVSTGLPTSGFSNTWIQGLINYCGQLPSPPTISGSLVGSGGSFSGSQTLYIKAIYRNKNGRALPSNEIGPFTPVANGSIQVTLPWCVGSVTVDLYGATSSGGETGATSLIASGIAMTGSNVTYTVTSATLNAGAMPTTALSNNTGLDFISHHFYDGQLGIPTYLQQQIPIWATAAGLGTLQIVSGEWDWQKFNVGTDPATGHYPWYQPGGLPNGSNQNIPPTAGTLSATGTPLSTSGPLASLPMASLALQVQNGTPLLVVSGSHSQVFIASSAVAPNAGAVSIPIQQSNAQYPATPNFAYPSGSTVYMPPYVVDFFQNDWHAAFIGAGMVAMQQAGYIGAMRYDGVDGSVFDANNVPQVLYNVSRMWGMTVGNTVLQTSTPYTTHPGLSWIASKDGSGNVYLFIANLNYRKSRLNLIDGALYGSHPVTIDVSAFGFANGQAVTTYMVDDKLSNAYDTAGASTSLQTVATASVQNGAVSIRMRPRSVALVKI